ncbi:nucleotidyltransferase family protein [Candidatus Amarolinea aalborgensis]|uniref:nucleotidyltransferase family protein n=1 Tax=Candidatus Amarolinea aalborgensis TaxID=2249329 RepID=UPI003BF9B84A
MNQAVVSRAAAVGLLTHWLRAAPCPPSWPAPPMAAASADRPFTLADWTVILQEAVRHGVHLLLAEHGQEIAAPDYVMRWLAAEASANERRNDRLATELVAILRGSASAGIELIPLKGAHLLLEPRGYPQPQLRPLADLDLLAPPGQVRTLRLVMQRQGYIEEPRTTWKHLNFIKPDNTRISSFSAGDPDNPRRVEVHLALAEDFLGLRLDLTALAWKHGAPGAMGSVPVRMLPSWLFFLHLAAHASQDVWERKARLLQVTDLQRVWKQLSREEVALIGAACGAPAAWFAALNVSGESPSAENILGGARLEPRLLLPALMLVESVFPDARLRGLTVALGARLQPGLRAWLQQISLADVSLSNPAPRRLADNLRWAQTPAERLGALRRLLLPDRYGLLGNRFPRLVSSPLFPLAYPLHLVFVGGWLQRRMRPRGQRAGGAFHQRMLDALAHSLAAEAAKRASKSTTPVSAAD